jgi:hypothetical protein
MANGRQAPSQSISRTFSEPPRPIDLALAKFREFDGKHLLDAADKEKIKVINKEICEHIKQGALPFAAKARMGPSSTPDWFCHLLPETINLAQAKWKDLQLAFPAGRSFAGNFFGRRTASNSTTTAAPNAAPAPLLTSVLLNPDPDIIWSLPQTTDPKSARIDIQQRVDNAWAETNRAAIKLDVNKSDETKTAIRKLLAYFLLRYPTLLFLFRYLQQAETHLARIPELPEGQLLSNFYLLGINTLLKKLIGFIKNSNSAFLQKNAAEKKDAAEKKEVYAKMLFITSSAAIHCSEALRADKEAFYYYYDERQNKQACAEAYLMRASLWEKLKTPDYHCKAIDDCNIAMQVTTESITVTKENKCTTTTYQTGCIAVAYMAVPILPSYLDLNPKLQQLIITDHPLDETTAEVFAKALAVCDSITTLHIVHCRLNDTNFKYFVGPLRKLLPRLEELSLSGNQLSSKSVLSVFLPDTSHIHEPMASEPMRLERLDLSRNPLTFNPTPEDLDFVDRTYDLIAEIGMILQRSLTCLVLNSCGLNDTHTFYQQHSRLHLLLTSTQFSTLQLAGNNLSSKCVQQFGQYLTGENKDKKRNRSLRTLDLCSKSLSDAQHTTSGDPHAAMVSCYLNNRSLTSLRLDDKKDSTSRALQGLQNRNKETADRVDATWSFCSFFIAAKRANPTSTIINSVLDVPAKLVSNFIDQAYNKAIGVHYLNRLCNTKFYDSHIPKTTDISQPPNPTTNTAAPNANPATIVSRKRPHPTPRA